MVPQKDLKQYRIEQHRRSLQEHAQRLASTSKGRKQMHSLWLFYTQGYLPNITECRKKAGLTQKQLADRIGISRQSLINYESNFTSPSLEVLSMIAKVLNVPIEDLAIENPEAGMTYEEFEANISNADMFIVIDDTGNHLQEVRQQAGLSIRELAELAKTSGQAISAIEEGSERGITRDVAKKICLALDKPLEEIFNL